MRIIFPCLAGLALVLAFGLAGCGSEEPIPNKELIINPLNKILDSRVLGQPGVYKVESVKRTGGERDGDHYHMDVEMKIRVMRDTDCTLKGLKGTLKNCRKGLKAGDYVYLDTSGDFTMMNGQWQLQ